MNKRFLSALAIGALALAIVSCNKSSSSGGSTTEGNWIKAAVFPGNARAYAVSFTIGDSVAFVGSGKSAVTTQNNYYTRLRDFYKFVPNGNTGPNGPLGSWTQVDSMQQGRQYAAAFSINGIGYVCGGFDDSITTTYLNDLYAYNPQTDRWTQKANFPGTPRIKAVGFSINNLGYIGTGQDYYQNALGTMYQYNPSSDSWTTVASSPGDKRYGAVAFTHNNLAYVVTGTNSGGSASADFFSFDGTNWNQLGDIINDNTSTTKDDSYTSITRTYGVAFVIGDWAYITTGTGNQNTWAYYFGDDHWEIRTPYQQLSREGAVGFGLGSYGYVGTGNASGKYVSNLSRFDPSETFDQNDDQN